MVIAGMVTGVQLIDNQIYRFDNGGVMIERITKQGWQKIGSDWYYVTGSGYVVCDEENYKIGDAYYSFDYDGSMLANEISYANNRYYDASGKAVTKQGWYQTANGWIYVQANGQIAREGVFRINNKDYYFLDGYWVK
jgi:glucan-binding YG repeat protein